MFRFMHHPHKQEDDAKRIKKLLNVCIAARITFLLCAISGNQSLLL